MGNDHDEHDRHRRHHGHTSAPDNFTHQPEVLPPPGKTTGIPLVDEGVLCHPHNKAHPIPASGCLDDDQIPDLMLSFATAALQMVGNLRAAIAKKEARLLTLAQASSTLWNILMEMGYGTGAGIFVGAIMHSAERFCGRVAEAVTAGGAMRVAGFSISGSKLALLAKVKPKQVYNIAVQFSKGVRTSAKNMATHRPSGPSVASAANVDRADMLSLLSNDFSSFATNLVKIAPSSMTDAEIVALTESMCDEDYHSQAAYEIAIDAFLDKYDSSHLAEVGDGKCVGEDEQGNRQLITVKHAVLVKSGTRSRMAVIEVYDPTYAKDQPTKGYDSKRVAWDQPEFIAWVNGDLSQYGEEFENERNGVMATIDATGGQTGMRQIDDWALDKGWGTDEASS